MTDALDAVLPHKKPMRLLTRLISASGDGMAMEATGLAVVDGGNPFLSEDGTLEPEALAEIMAQCFAAGAGSLKAGAKRNAWGYLAGMRRVRIRDTARAGDILRVSVRVVLQMGELTVVEGKITNNGTEIASGEFKIFIPIAEEDPA